MALTPFTTGEPDPEAEAGQSLGLYSNPGYPWDPNEPNSALGWPQSIRVFDRMAHEDAEVRAALSAITLPIRRAAWQLDPNGARDEVVQLLAEDLNVPVLGTDDDADQRQAAGRFSWAAHLARALDLVKYGHSVFEIVCLVRDGKVRLDRLGVRMPVSIARIHVDHHGDLLGIEQYPAGGMPASGGLIAIPAAKLVFYSLDRIGGLYQGQSMLRSAYKHWITRDEYLRLDLMAFERHGVVVPTVEGSPGATDADLADLAELATQFRGGDSAGIALPAGTRLRLEGVSGGMRDPEGMIRYHDGQIAKSVLATFLELGQTGVGARSLGETQVDFFTLSLQAVADEIAQQATDQLLTRLVEWNFGPDEIVPQLVCAEIGADRAASFEALSSMVSAGAIAADDTFRAWLRETLRIPAESGDALAPEPPVEASRGKARAAVAAATPASIQQTARAEKLRAALRARHAGPIKEALAEQLDPQAVADDWWTYEDDLWGDEERASKARGFAAGLVGSLALGALAVAIRSARADGYVGGYAVGDALWAKVGATTVTPPWGERLTPADVTRGGTAVVEAANIVQAAAADGTATERAVTLYVDATAQAALIGQTTVDRVAAALANTDVPDALVDALTAALGDVARAERVADYETAVGVQAGTTDMGETNGGEVFAWVLDAGLNNCAECETLAGLGAQTLDEWGDEPPIHGNCGCALVPVPGGTDPTDLTE
jgi:hypothetical protein